MGCVRSSQARRDENAMRIRKPQPWRHIEAITREEFNQMREDFWQAAPHNQGGRREIWNTLRTAAESEPRTAQIILESADITIQNPDMTICYDDRGARYELPLFVLSEPRNLIRVRRRR